MSWLSEAGRNLNIGLPANQMYTDEGRVATDEAQKAQNARNNASTFIGGISSNQRNFYDQNVAPIQSELSQQVQAGLNPDYATIRANSRSDVAKSFQKAQDSLSRRMSRYGQTMTPEDQRRLDYQQGKSEVTTANNAADMARDQGTTRANAFYASGADMPMTAAGGYAAGATGLGDYYDYQSQMGSKELNNQMSGRLQVANSFADGGEVKPGLGMGGRPGKTIELRNQFGSYKIDEQTDGREGLNWEDYVKERGYQLDKDGLVSPQTSAKGYAHGGEVALKTGDYIIRADVVKALGPEFFDKLEAEANAGEAKGEMTPDNEKAESGFAEGGNVGDDFNTKLSPQEETQFQDWKAKNAPHDSGADYDLRGAFKAGLAPSPENGHWSDQFKKPNHPTFSDQSQYAAHGNPGRWEGEKFIPGTRPGYAAGGAVKGYDDGGFVNSYGMRDTNTNFDPRYNFNGGLTPTGGGFVGGLVSGLRAGFNDRRAQETHDAQMARDAENQQFTTAEHARTLKQQGIEDDANQFSRDMQTAAGRTLATGGADWHAPIDVFNNRFPGDKKLDAERNPDGTFNTFMVDADGNRTEAGKKLNLQDYIRGLHALSNPQLYAQQLFANKEKGTYHTQVQDGVAVTTNTAQDTPPRVTPLPSTGRPDSLYGKIVQEMLMARQKSMLQPGEPGYMSDDEISQAASNFVAKRTAPGQAGGMPPPATQPSNLKPSYRARNGRVVTAAEINATASGRGKTPQQVITDLGLQ